MSQGMSQGMSLGVSLGMCGFGGDGQVWLGALLPPSLRFAPCSTPLPVRARRPGSVRNAR